MKKKNPRLSVLLPTQPITLLAYSIHQAAAAANIGENTLQAAIGSGALRARKVRGRTLVLPSDIEAWLHSLPSRETVPHLVAKAAAAAADASAAEMDADEAPTAPTPARPARGRQLAAVE